jgi:hypothetical protein
MHLAPHHYYHLSRMTEMKRLYWTHTLTTLASTLVSIFVPIFLYRNGYAIDAILEYQLWTYVFAVPLMYLSSRSGGSVRTASSPSATFSRW